MTQILGLTAFAGILLFLCWLFSGNGKKKSVDSPSEDKAFDAEDSAQIGFLIGLTGGSIPDAATARFALRRFEEIHKRKATAKDIGTIIGLTKSL